MLREREAPRLPFSFLQLFSHLYLIIDTSNKMTIDLGQTDLTMYLNGVLPTNGGVRVTLKSKYSNTNLWSNLAATAIIYDEWYTLQINNNDYTNKGVSGYYLLTVEYFTDTWVVLNSYLIKAINSSNSLDVPESYQSDNEPNQNYVYYEDQ